MGNWKSINIIKLADYINGFGFKPIHWTKEGLPIVRIEQLKNPDSKYDYCSILIPENNIIDNGDLIFSWSASLFLKIWDREKAALNQHLFKVIPKEDTDKLFLKYLLEYNLVELTKAAHGSTMQHITRKELGQFKTLIPVDKPEQTRIAEILSTANKAIVHTEALIAKHQRIKTGLMQDLLAKGIDEYGNIRGKATHKFVVQNGIEVPVEWKVDTLDTLIKAVDAQPNHRTPPSVENGIPYIGISDIDENGNIDLKKCRKVASSVLEEHNRRYKLEDGDIIFGKIGTIGEPKRLKAWNNITISANVILIQPLETPDFIFWVLNSEYIHTQVKNSIHSTSQPAFGMGKIRNLTILIPPKKEREYIQNLLNQNEANILSTKTHLAKLNSLKTGLMQDLLSGKVRVS